MTTYLILYILSALLEAGWVFATLHRDGITDQCEWGRDLRFSILVGLILGVLGPITVYLLWAFGGSQQGWTLIPDRKS